MAGTTCPHHTPPFRSRRTEAPPSSSKVGPRRPRDS
nr:MAG TPA: hypothetical protein [Caudoviricetes sp.]